MGGPDARARGARVATQGDVGQGEGERGRDVIEGYVWGYARGRGRDGPWLGSMRPSLSGLPVIVAAALANRVIGPEEDGGILGTQVYFVHCPARTYCVTDLRVSEHANPEISSGRRH